MHKKSKIVSSKPQKKQKIVVFLAIFFVLTLCVAAWIRFHKHSVVIPSQVAGSTSKPAEPGTSDKLRNSSSQTSTGANSSDKASSSAAAALVSPSGSFVSNHRPSLSSNGAPSTEQSVCNTTPQANCEIRFSKASEIRTLQPQTTDANGSAYWNWDVKTAGLSVGSWQITAYATLNNKTLSASDSMNLEVAP